MAKLHKDLVKAHKRFDQAEAVVNKQIDKALSKILANQKISKKRAAKLMAAHDEVNRYSAKVERLELKAAKKAEKKAKKRPKQIAYPETAAVLEAERTAEEERMARRVEKERAAAQLSAFALEPSHGTLPNPSNPYSDENYAFFRDLLEKRTKHSRFEHSLAVADTCAKMAEAYGLDIPQARIAGLLHDWDKSLNHEALVRRVSQYSLDIDADIVAGMPWILHGPTAAAVLRDQYPVLRTPVFQSIERHTVGAPDMAPLDMVVFCADKLEPGHKVAVYRELYEQIGILSLEDLFFQVLKEGLVYVLDSGLPLNRDSVAVWNWYIEHLL